MRRGKAGLIRRFTALERLRAAYPPQFAQRILNGLFPRSANAALATAPAVLLAILSFRERWRPATGEHAKAGASGYLIAFARSTPGTWRR